ncbi:hypothetical protein EDB81DRAFT_759423 [Dactylonectria macrodidyma]|uniref:Fucose-specific lectin n=1 Tax=Dactylonectria macrodidyma TaxID=307937 RepID=A0A9P9EWW7_9HYPO|nr:hypothetical protein EDB81DRAFT_759423 [Dactylonectria macrodidyma]
MSCPLTSIVNPLNEKEIYFFYLTQNKGTGLEIYGHPRPDKVVVTEFQGNIKTPPEDDLIVNPGSFSSLVTNGVLNVYGLMKLPSASTKTGDKPGGGSKEVDASDTKLVAQLSPVFKLLMPEDDSKVQGVALTTTIDKNGQSWMYGITTNDKNIPVIKAIKLGWKESSVTSTIVTTKPPLLSTNLATFYDPLGTKSFIIYQDKKTLCIVEAGNTEDKEIPNTSDSRDMTGLACVPVKGQRGVKVYLYYFADKGGQLQRVVRDEDGKWSDSNGRDDQDSEQSSFLTATQMGDDIAVYYMVKGATSRIYISLDPNNVPARVKDN